MSSATASKVGYCSVLSPLSIITLPSTCDQYFGSSLCLKRTVYLSFVGIMTTCAPAHNALSVKSFLAKLNKMNKILVLKHLPYSRDLTPCDFFLFPEIKSIKRNPYRVRRCSEGKSDGSREQKLSEEDLQHYFQ